MKFGFAQKDPMYVHSDPIYAQSGPFTLQTVRKDLQFLNARWCGFDIGHGGVTRDAAYSHTGVR